MNNDGVNEGVNDGAIKGAICPTCEKHESFMLCSNPFHYEYAKKHIPLPTEKQLFESMFIRAFYANTGIGDRQEIFEEWLMENKIMGINGLKLKSNEL